LAKAAGVLDRFVVMFDLLNIETFGLSYFLWIRFDSPKIKAKKVCNSTLNFSSSITITRGFVIIKRCGKTIVAIFKVESKELELELELERQSNLLKTTLLV